MWATDQPHSQEAKSINAKVSRILSMVGSTIPYSPFECAVTRLHWMLCNIVMVLAQIKILVHPLSLKICWHWDFVWNQKTMIQNVLYQNEVSHNQIFLIKYVMKLPYVCVGYHTRKITLPVMPLTVPVTLSIPVMSAAHTSTLYFTFFLANPLRYVPIQSTSTVITM